MAYRSINGSTTASAVASRLELASQAVHVDDMNKLLAANRQMAMSVSPDLGFLEPVHLKPPSNEQEYGENIGDPAVIQMSGDTINHNYRSGPATPPSGGSLLRTIVGAGLIGSGLLGGGLGGAAILGHMLKPLPAVQQPVPVAPVIPGQPRYNLKLIPE